MTAASDLRGRACTRCGEWKPFANFMYISGKPGPRCKVCIATKAAEYRLAKPEKTKEYAQTGNRKRAAIKRAERIAQGLPVRMCGPRETKEGRRCSRCEQRYPRSEFHSHLHKGRNDTLCIYCRKCHSINRRERFFKIKYEVMEDLLEAQSGMCKICSISISLDMGRASGIDHCHKSGKIRGILCTNCNTGIGMFFDNPIVMRKAADYIESCVEK